MKGLRLIGLLGLALLASVPALIAHPQNSAEAEAEEELKVVEVKEPDGQILSYRHLAGSTEVRMKGTRLAPQAKLHLKVGSRPGFVELDINRGAISGLKPAHFLGKDFLTYVLWAVSVDGRASNLGEITFEGNQPISVNVTTPYQTFWLMVTAEPNFAVVDPSPRVVLYSVGKKGAKETSDKRALVVRSDLFYFTHYTTYDSAKGGALERAPNQLLQARKAVELASKSGILATDRSAGTKEEEYTREALVQANAFLARAEAAYRKDAKGRDVVQFARTAAQSAENARSLAMGAVGNLVQRQLETNVAKLRKQVAKLKGSNGEKGEPGTLARLAAQPALWFAVVGWGVAIALLFRRRAI